MTAEAGTNEEAEQTPPPRRRPRLRVADETPPASTEEWTMTYMDTVTLLITLFVLLLSFSTINKEKFEAVAEGLNLKKYGPNILSGKITDLKKAKPDVSALPPQPSQEEQAELRQDAAQSVTEQISQLGLTSLVNVKVSRELIDLQLNESVLFTSGESLLTGQGFSVLSKLVEFLMKSGMNISVEGHTDNLPIETDLYPSNWELSAARAAAVARALISDGVPASRLHIRGYADTLPVADNATAEGRQKNRRVSLVLKKAADSSAKQDER